MADNRNGNSGGGSGGGSGGAGGGPNYYDQSAKFNPTTAVVIISLIGGCFLLAFVSVSLRRCLRGESAARTTRSGASQQQQSGSYNNVKSKGLEKSAVDALPLVHRADLDDHVISECPVCLTDFEPEEPLRLLPSCKHVFHQECIDAWFDAHSTCPLCRASLLVPDATPVPVLPAAAGDDPAAEVVGDSEQASSVLLPGAATPPLGTGEHLTESGTECDNPAKEPSFRIPSMRLTGDLIALRNLVTMRGQNEAPSRRWFTRARSLELPPGRGGGVEPEREREEWVTIDLETGKAAAPQASSGAAIAEGAQGGSSSSSSGSGERALPERAWSERWSLRGAVRFPLARSTSDVSSARRPSAILPI